MRYGITIAAVGDWPFVEICADDFNAIKAAKSRVLMLLDIEEDFELLAGNYSEYETAILEIVQRTMVRGYEPWTTGMDDLLLINRRLANVLTAARSYDDHARHAISTLYGRDSKAWDGVCAAFSRQYDQALGYRAMVALRNHMQHQSLPVQNIRYGSDKINPDGQCLVRFALQPKLDLATLRASGFKKSVLKELESAHENANVTALLREFVGGLGLAHQAVRELTMADSQEWKRRIGHVLEIGRMQFDQMLGLAAVSRDEEGNHPEVVEIFEDMIRRLDLLRARYGHVGFLKDWFISSESV